MRTSGAGRGCSRGGMACGASWAGIGRSMRGMSRGMSGGGISRRKDGGAEIASRGAALPAAG